MDDLESYVVGFVGGGLAGLTAAYRIAQHFVANNRQPRIVIWEQADRVGGRVGTLYNDDSPNSTGSTGIKPLELGAAVMSVDIHKHVLPLMQELGFDMQRDFSGPQ